MEKLNRNQFKKNIRLKLQDITDQYISTKNYEEQVLKKIFVDSKKLLDIIKHDKRITNEEYFQIKKSIDKLLKAITYKKIIIKNKLNMIKELTKDYGLDYSTCHKPKKECHYKIDPIFTRW